MKKKQKNKNGTGDLWRWLENMIGLKDYILLAESDKSLGVEIDIILFLVENIILMISR